MKEFEINNYITLKLEDGNTFIYIKNRRFLQCIQLVLNIPTKSKDLYDEINSIDEASEVNKTYLYQGSIIKNLVDEPLDEQTHSITPEQEFWGHCSNLQLWVENNYDTRLIQ